VDSSSGTPPSPERTTRVVLVLGAPTGRATVPAWCDRVRSLLRHAPGAVVECDVEGLSGSATDVVDALSRLRLVALRCGGELRLLRADPALLAVLDLFGFTDLLPASDAPPDPSAGDLDRNEAGATSFAGEYGSIDENGQPRTPGGGRA
jgi:hypothetical protein